MSCINCRYGLWHIELTSIRYAGLTQLGRELYWQVHCQCQQSQTETVQHVKRSPTPQISTARWYTEKAAQSSGKGMLVNVLFRNIQGWWKRQDFQRTQQRAMENKELEINTQETEPGPIGEHSQLPAWWDLLTPASRISELLWIDDFYVI